MPFTFNCPQKNCHAHMEPYIDPKTDKVYCANCDQEITNITHFAKVQMKTLKQYKQKKQVSFATKCQKCSKEERPIILNNKICCPSCKQEHTHLSDLFKNMLKEELKNIDKDD